jgi:hypothetical protein
MWFNRKREASAPEEEDTSPRLDDLARLYTPEPAPKGMTDAFESAFRSRSVATAPVREYRGRASRLRLGVAGGIAALAAATAVLAIVLLPGGARQPSVAEAQAFLAQIPDHLEVQPGQVLHTRSEVYERYGPKAADIAAGTGIATERYTQESWIEVGPNNNATRTFARIVDANGKVVKESKFENGTLTEIEPATGVSRTPPQPILENGELKLNGASSRAAAYERALTSGITTVVRQNSSEITLRTYEELTDLAPTPSYGPGAYVVPFYADLDGVAIITIETIRGDGTVPQGDVYVLTKSGKSVLVQSATSVDEVLDSMPAGIFGGN